VTSLLDGSDVPIYAVAGVDEVIRRDDAAKEQILRPMFGDEWPAARTFLNRIVRAGERVEIGDAVFADDSQAMMTIPERHMTGRRSRFLVGVRHSDEATSLMFNERHENDQQGRRPS
jgi:hypothetical protein